MIFHLKKTIYSRPREDSEAAVALRSVEAALLRLHRLEGDDADCSFRNREGSEGGALRSAKEDQVFGAARGALHEQAP